MASTRSSGSQRSYELDAVNAKGSKGTLRYPLESYTESQEKFPGYIRFDAIRQYTSKNARPAGASLTANIEGVAGDVAQAAEANLREVTRGSQVKVREGSAVLYMPPGFEIQDGVEYDNINLKASGLTVQKAMARGNEVGVGKALTDAAGSALKNITNATEMAKTASGGDLIRSILTDTVANFMPENLSNAVRSGAQVRSNPNTQSIFQGVGLRTFGFNFQMLPTSAKEAEQIAAIVKFFRTAMYPMKQADAYYKFPVKFEITMFYKGQVLKPRILPSFLTSATTSFNGETGTFHNDGSYTQTNLGLSFQEERTLSAQDVGQDDY